MTLRQWLPALLLCLALMDPLTPAARADTVIFAAASTTDAVNSASEAFAKLGKGRITASFAASSTLAKQIENGAPAAIFLSADEQWMDYLDQRKLIAPDSRVDLLGNNLVLIAPADSAVQVTIGPNFPLAGLLGDGRLSVGDPAHVPAGIYAQAALVKLGVWDAVKDRLAAADSVRSALAFVERGETPLGIVYGTDAAISRKVKIVATFPADSHPPILYPAALVAGHETSEARAFLDFLESPDGRAIFARYGFTSP